MSGVDFISLYNKYCLTSLIGVDDWVDRLSYIYSYILLLGFAILVTTKTYLFRPIACHMPTAPQGANFKNYVESACWILGTIPIRANEPIPQTEEEFEQLSKERRINYYQWVPFILAIQCIMFYLPRLAWQSVSFNRLGTDLNVLVSQANQALVASTRSARKASIGRVAHALEMLLFAHRDYRHGTFANLRRRLSRALGFLFVSKRFGTWIVFSYFCIKLAYFMNTVIQLYFMKVFLGYDQALFPFEGKMFGSLLSDGDWADTLYFPRKAYCPISLRHLGTKGNFYLGVCALPINMFNEKIYIFLYFWITVVMLLTLLSIPVWLIRIGTKRRRTAIIYKYLRLRPPEEKSEPGSETSSETSSLSHNSVDPAVKSNVETFVENFLRVDGVFLIHILTANAGDVVTGEIVGLLWHAWVLKYAGRKEWERPTECHSDSETDDEPGQHEAHTLTEPSFSDGHTEIRHRVRKHNIDDSSKSP
ncbi:Innexin [Paragonimus heterotremus]|uniref:Innexin n=1 Tax=Paragonimus heterotremus TaxID=100268 RepID=A0A8J4TM64_9TREM|nr:Innexin [Paragonimus heterotremus]